MKTKILADFQICISVPLIPWSSFINKLIPIQILIPWSSFIKIRMSAISIAVLILFQRSILRA